MRRKLGTHGQSGAAQAIPYFGKPEVAERLGSAWWPSTGLGWPFQIALKSDY